MSNYPTMGIPHILNKRLMKMAKRGFSAILAAALILNASPLVSFRTLPGSASGGPQRAYAAPAALAASAEQSGPGGSLAYADAFEKIADPATDNAVDYFPPSTLEDGRLWTDKTVSAGKAVIYDAAGKPADVVEASADEFLITLSALSQSYSTDTLVEPSDTVFILDVSASMYINKLDNGMSRVEAMVGALNEAIATLMEGNPHNRIAVVAFGGNSGNSRICPILKLGRYNVKDGQYFSMKSAAYIQVSTQIPNSSLFDINNRSVRVYGGTPTQRGIYAGAKVLLDNADTEYTYTDKGRQLTVARKPNIVLLSDGGATLGWTDYRFENGDSDTDDGFDHGDANAVDMGISTLTVLTAAYCKQRVRDHYYGDDNASGEASFYTVGLSIGGTGNDAPAVLNPAGYADKVNRVYLKNTYNMKSVLEDFVNSSGDTDIYFPALIQNSPNVRDLTYVTNYDNYVKSYDYTDYYYTAERADELSGAFNSIVRRITSTGNYITNVSGDEDYNGYLVFSDTPGEHMEFKRSLGLWYDNRAYDGRLFARNISTGGNSAYMEKFIDTLLEYQNNFGAGEAEARGIARSLLESCIKAGKANGGLYYNNETDFGNKITYYADEDRRWVGNYFDGGGAPAAPGGAKCVIEMYTIEGAVVNYVSG